MTPLPEPRAESGATRYLTRLGSECEFVIRTYVGPGCFTRPTGDLDLQLSRRTDHVETWSPPYVCYQLSVAGPCAAWTDGAGGRRADILGSVGAAASSLDPQ
jgi:hypothetical protein